MEKLNLNDYREEILSIAEANHVEEHIARDMFAANVRTGGKGQYYYAGAEHVDYATLKEEWDTLDKPAQAAILLAYEGSAGLRE